MAKELHIEGHHVIMLVKKKNRKDEFIVEYINNSVKYRLKIFISKLFRVIKSSFIRNLKIDNPVYRDDYYFLSKNEKIKNISSKSIKRQISFIPEIIYAGMTNDFINSTDLLEIKKMYNASVFCLAVDMNHFTGGCHYAWDCNGYVTGCTDKCPAILSKRDKKNAKRNFNLKMQNALQGDFKIIAMSEWTLNQAKRSKIYKFQNEIINVNGLVDPLIFNNQSKKISKDIFRMDSKKFYVLLGSQDINDKRKGLAYSIQALNILFDKLNDNQRLDVEVVIVSNSDINDFTQLKFTKKYIDYIQDYRLLSLLYQACDVFVNSSIEDSGPMMVSEALACGTPVVGFDMGVVTNMVISGFNGYKAKLKDSFDLYKGLEIIFFLSPEQKAYYSQNAINQVEKYSSINKLDKKLNIV